MKKLLHRIEINMNMIVSNVFKIWGVFFPLYWGVVFSGYFGTVFGNVLNCILFVIAAAAFIVFISIFLTLRIKERTIFHSSTNKALEVQFGDIFSNEAEIKVIPVNRCFDTIVNNTVISNQSLHGQLIKQHLNHLSYEEFCEKLKRGLRDQVGEEIPNKINGNQIRYPVGTIVEIEDGGVIYYLLGMTKMDEVCQVSCTTEDYFCAIGSLMRYYDAHGQGKTIAIPNLGAGFSRLNQTEQILLNSLTSTIHMHQNCMRGNVKIIVHESQKSIVSITDLR